MATSAQWSLDLTPLQLSIIHTATEHPDYVYDEIATECDCAPSTVGRTIRRTHLPDRNRPVVEAASSLEDRERLRWHTTMDALAWVGDLIQSAEERATAAREARAKIEETQKEVQQAVKEALAVQLTPTQSVEPIREVVELRLQYYPTDDLLADLGAVGSAKEPQTIAELNSLSTVLSELIERCTALEELDGLSSGRRREYETASQRYQAHVANLQTVIERRCTNVDIIPLGNYKAEVERIRHKRITQAAQTIHEALASDTRIDSIIQQYSEVARQATPNELIGRQGLGEPVHEGFSPRGLEGFCDTLKDAPAFTHV